MTTKAVIPASFAQRSVSRDLHCSGPVGPGSRAKRSSGMTLVLGALLALFLPIAAHAMTVKTVAGPTGVETWLSEEHALPMIAVNISFPAGAAYDPSGKPGLDRVEIRGIPDLLPLGRLKDPCRLGLDLVPAGGVGQRQAAQFNRPNT